MRRRITLTMVGVVAGALLLATFGTAAVSWLGARADTRRDLTRQASQIAVRLDEVQRPGVLAALAAVLRLQDVRVVCVGTNGAVQATQAACRGATPLPAGLSIADLNLARLRAGGTVSGTQGSLVYAAAGVPRGTDTLFVVVLTRRVGTRLPGGLWFVLVAGLTLAAVAAVASNLGRRLTRPLREAQAATHRIAVGDLATRVPVNPEDGEELTGLAESINTMAATLERSRGLERQFLLSVSHDLRTPLTSIRGYAEALAEGQAPDAAHAAGVILTESRRLERLVQDLLELAKLDARRFSLDMRRVDVGEVLAQTAEGFQPAAEKLGIVLERATVTTPAVATADADRLAQIVANLVENGLKYARSVVHLTARPEGGLIELAVEDDGPGITADDLPHVFEPFYHSTRTPTREVGTGLGLAIVHELVDAMGGSTRAEPAGTGGTRMVITLRSA